MSGVYLRSIVKKYGEVTAVSGIDLDIEDGELVVLLGPSGCGKTTTLRCIAGLEDISDGEIHMEGRIVSSKGYLVPPEQRAIGMVFQSYAIWPHMSVTENVAFGLRMKKLPRKEIDRRVRSALEMVGLSEYQDRGASQLSGGQQQRVALARAIVLEPRVLLFDEPLSNLDAKLRERMRLELRELQRRLGITSVYVTHDQQEALVIADRIVLMNHGRIDQIGTPDEVYRRPASRFGAEFVGLANILPSRVVPALAGDAGSRFEIEGGVQLVSADHAGRPGDSVDLLFRPENIRFSSDPLEGENVLKAELDTSYFLGNIADIFVKVGPHKIRGQISPPQSWKAGQALWMQIPPDSVIVLPNTQDSR